MAFTFSDLPEDVELVGCSPVKVTLETDRKVNEFLYKRLRIIATFGSISDGDEFSFSYADLSFTFTFRTTADDSGNEIEIGLATSYATLATELLTNAGISENFKLIVSGGDLQLEPLIGFDFDFDYTAAPASISLTEVFSPNSNYEPNLKILLISEFEEDSTWKILAKHLKTPGDDDRVNFDITNDFDLKYPFPIKNLLPSTSIFVGTQTDIGFINYRLRWAEQYGDPPQTRKLFVNKTFVALKGGISWLNRTENWWNIHSGNNKWLTLQPYEKRIGYDQPEFLYWIGKNIATVNFAVRVDYVLADGTTNGFILIDGFDVEYGKIYYFPTNWRRLGLFSTSANPLVSYEFYMQDKNSTFVTQKMKYVIDPMYLDYERYYMFGNSWGGVDTLRGTGKVVSTAKYKWQEASNYEDINQASGNLTQLLQYDKKEQLYFKGSIGHKDKEYITYLKEILISEEVRIADTVNGEYIPILVTSNSIDLYKDDDDLYFLNWEYKLAFEDCAHDNFDTPITL